MATDVTFVANVDLSTNELRNARAHILAAAPTGIEGRFYYNSVTHKFEYYNGTVWVAAGEVTFGSITSPASFGQSNSDGTASTAARSDHSHALPAHDAAAHSGIKVSDLAAPSANLAMSGYKLTGLGAGSANGDSVRYEQVVGVYLPLAGGTMAGSIALNGNDLITGYDGLLVTGTMAGKRAEIAGNASTPFVLNTWSAGASTPAGLSTDGTTWNMTGALAMNSAKITGLAAGTANGDAVRYEQVVGVYAPLASPALTGTPTAPTAAAATNTTQIATTAYVKSQGYATTASPTFTGTVVLPSTTSIGNVDSTEIGYLDGVTSAIQTQLNAKAPLASPALTGTPTAPTAAAGTNSTQIATTAFVQAAVQASAAGLDVKQSVRAATTGNVDLASGMSLSTVDGVSVAVGERVLVKNQNTASENGIYIRAAGTSANTWATDFDTSAKVTPNTFVFVEEGTTNADTGWVLTTNAPITLGTTGLTFTQFTGAGQITAGAGLTKTGSTVDVGAGTGISVAADTVSIDTSVVARKYSATLSTSATSYTVTHNLGTRDVQVSVVQTGSPYGVVYTAWEATTTNTITVYFATAPTANSLRVNVVG